MKKWQSIINIKSMRISLVLLLVIATILIVMPMLGTTNNALEILEQKRFVFVQNPKYTKMYNNEYGIGFDLQKKLFFIPFHTAIRNNTVFGGYTNPANAKQTFKEIHWNEFSSVILNSGITTDEIKKSKYQVVLSTESVVDKSLFENKFVPELELKYALKEQEFSKIRITYNKDFLPTKIEWYYKGEEGLKWYTWRTYSYPFKNKAEFDKRLDEEIANIEEIARENEGD
ncbi:hypothetical protein [Streptococcus sp. Marseille-Q8145]